MLSVLTTIALVVIAVLLFELIILFHEGGHFITAKKSGVQVNEFAIGMGPKLISFKKGETMYSLRLFPIGGYCSMEAEDEESENPRAFTNAKIWKRMIIIVAGAFMNIVLGLIMMFALITHTTIMSTTITSFYQGSYSANCGLQKGDTIVKFNDYDILTSQDLQFAIATMKCKNVDGSSDNIYKQDCANGLVNLYYELSGDKNSKYSNEELQAILNKVTEGTTAINATSSKKEAQKVYETFYKNVNGIAGVKSFKIPNIEIKETRPRFRADVVVNRNGNLVELKDVDLYTYMADKDAKEPSVSVDFSVGIVEKNFGTVIQQTGLQTLSAARMVWSSLVGLVTGQFGFNDLSGPVGVASAVTQAASSGLESGGFLEAFDNILYIMMLISVNLGIFNMLPFPALDGGRFLFLLIEGIFKKPVPRKIEAVINAVGLGILLLFMLLITVKDVWQLLPFFK